MTGDPDRDRARAALREAVATTPETIAEVVTALDAIARAAAGLVPRGDDDGIACFTRLYAAVTREIGERYDHDRFHAGDFIERLDVAFAGRYLAALRADLAEPPDRPSPRCWRALFDARRDDEVHPWAFAAMGVNAHVNFDLAFALLAVWEAERRRGVVWTPALVEAQYRDYDQVNDVFDDLMDGLLRQFRAPGADWGGDGSLVDRGVDALSELLVRRTRDLAWDTAVAFWNDPDGDPDTLTRDTDAAAGALGAMIRTLGRWL